MLALCLSGIHFVFSPSLSSPQGTGWWAPFWLFKGADISPALYLATQMPQGGSREVATCPGDQRKANLWQICSLVDPGWMGMQEQCDLRARGGFNPFTEGCGTGECHHSWGFWQPPHLTMAYCHIFPHCHAFIMCKLEPN